MIRLLYRVRYSGWYPYVLASMPGVTLLTMAAVTA
jgi:hypothetical protein